MVKECTRCGKEHDEDTKYCSDCKNYFRHIYNRPDRKNISIRYSNKFRVPKVGVYALKCDDEFIYVGSSDNMPFRLYQHFACNQSFDDGLTKLQREMKYKWHVLWYGDSHKDAQHQEKCLIQLHQPKFNKIKYLNYEK